MQIDRISMKKTFPTELAYLIGITILAFGAAFMAQADFGMSMVVAPAYLLHLKVSQVLPFFSFGMAEYTLQAVLLIVLAVIMRRFKWSYLFSLGTAVFYGFLLDIFMKIVTNFPAETAAWRVVWYIVGLMLCTAGVSLLFHTYISPEAYELFVKEVSAKFHMDISKFKTIYDCISCLVAILMSFLFFGWGHFEGVKLGTVICALVNGWMIGRFTKIFESVFEFKDGLRLRK